MISRLAEQAKQEKKVQDYLDNQDGLVDTNIASTAKNLGIARDAMGGNVADALTGAVQKFGLNPSIAGVGSESVVAQGIKLGRQQEEALSGRKLTEKRSNLNRLYQFALDKAQNAGMGLKESDAFAREWALTQDQQGWAAGEADKDRQFTTEKANIGQRYNEITANMEPDTGDPYQEALARSLLGFAGTLGTGYALGTFKKKVPAKQVTLTQNPVGTGSTLTEQSGFATPGAMDLSKYFKKSY